VNSEALELVEKANSLLNDYMARHISRLVRRIVLTSCNNSKRKYDLSGSAQELRDDTAQNIPLLLNRFSFRSSLYSSNLINLTPPVLILVNCCSLSNKTVGFFVILIDQVDLKKQCGEPSLHSESIALRVSPFRLQKYDNLYRLESHVGWEFLLVRSWLNVEKDWRVVLLTSRSC
jgi:hypothetical protein